jgi:hypothetical protein
MFPQAARVDLRLMMRMRVIVTAIGATLALQSLGCTSDPPPGKHCGGGAGVYDLETCKYEGPPPQTVTGGLDDASASDAAQGDAALEEAGASDAGAD